MDAGQVAFGYFTLGFLCALSLVLFVGQVVAAVREYGVGGDCVER